MTFVDRYDQHYGGDNGLKDCPITQDFRLDMLAKISADPDGEHIHYSEKSEDCTHYYSI